MEYTGFHDWDMEQMYKESGVAVDLELNKSMRKHIDEIELELIDRWKCQVVEKQVNELLEELEGDMTEFDVENNTKDWVVLLKDKMEDKLQFDNEYGFNHFNYAASCCFDNSIYHLIDKKEFIELGFSEEEYNILSERYFLKNN